MITAKNIVKTYSNGTVDTQVLKGIDLEVKEGEWLAILGKSGAGKSTLLYQLSLLDQPTSGTITIDGVETSSLNNRLRTKFRLERLGYIFQDYALVPELTAQENVAVPLIMLGKSNEEAFRIAREALEHVSLEHRYDNLPSQLSGGEQQRVSIARAVAQEPNILFADEPTASLDSSSSEEVIAVMKQLHDAGQTIVMVTHEIEYTTYCDRIIHLDDGRIEKEERNGTT